MARPESARPRSLITRAACDGRPPRDGYAAIVRGTVSSVWATGSFAGWAATPTAGALMMRDDDGDGEWTVSAPLPSGRHEYKFIVDGQSWSVDPKNPQAVVHESGNENSVLSCR